MSRRIFFNSVENREDFFKKVLESNNLKKWSELGNIFSISKSTFEFYRNGRLTLPEELYKNLTNKFEERDKIFFDKNVKFLDSNWGRVKAGKVTYSKYKNIFDKGREKAISFQILKAKRFNINLPLNNELAYFMGLFIGDGFTNKYAGNYLIQFTGDLKEKKFYEELVSGYCVSLFGINPKIKMDKYANCIRVNISSKALFEMITKRFKIGAGRKSHTVLIPEEILNSKAGIVRFCIRGLYDAEGCVFIDKRKSYKIPYARIELHMCNLPLLKQVYSILSSFGISSTLGTSKDNLRITIYTAGMVKKFIKEIGFSNPKQLDKLRSVGLVV